MTPRLKPIGTALQVAGAAALASASIWPPFCYLLMLAGALCWLIAGGLARDRQLVVLNGFWVALNLVGLVRWGGLLHG